MLGVLVLRNPACPYGSHLRLKALCGHPCSTLTEIWSRLDGLSLTICRLFLMPSDASFAGCSALLRDPQRFYYSMKKLISGRLMALLLMTLPLLALAHGISEADKQSMLDGGYVRYIGLGASHMLTGYDHLLFLFGVVFFLSTFKDVAKFVTVFTMGHCITLIFATYRYGTIKYEFFDNFRLKR
jgi:HupE / UreJ protein